MVSTSTIYTITKYGLGITAGIPVILATSLWYLQRSLIYPASFPEGSRTDVPIPTDAALPFEDVTLTTSDGLNLKAYFIPARERVVPLHELRGLQPPQMKERGKEEMNAWLEVRDGAGAQYVKSRPTVLMFHANAGNVGHRIPLARKFVSELHCNVFMISYRGYGKSEGSPSEAGIRIDAAAAMEWIAKNPLLKDTKLILYGQSIGGAVAISTAAAFPDMVSGIIVENTFVSLTDLVPCVMPFLPPLLVNLLLTERWDARKAMKQIREDIPILMLSGQRDEIVPQAQMKELRQLRGNGKVRWREFNGSHNDTYIVPGYWEEIEKWIDEEVIGSEKKE